MKKITKTLVLSSISIGLLSSFAFTSQAAPVQVNQASAEQNIPQVTYDTIIGENGVFIDLDTDNFILKQQEWYQIQAYVEGALALPVTEASMKSTLSIPNDIPFSNFQALVEQYSNIHDTAFYWKKDLYPSIVGLSLSLANYAQIKDYMLTPLSDALNEMLAKAFSPLPEDIEAVERNRKMAIAYLKSLQNFSMKYQQEVSDVGGNLLEFSATLDTQKLQLDVLEGTHNGYLSDDGSALQQRVNDINARITQLNKDYTHYVTVASTAVTYAWFPLVAGPIMGVYGDKAEKARKLRNELQNEVKELQEQLTYTQKIYNSYHRSSESIEIISQQIENAIPHINKLKLNWQKMNADFTSLLVALEQAQDNADIMRDDTMLGAIGALANTTVAESNWSNISEKAKAFANNAYIQKMD
ncbi:alpha-xenorhabdolysin family binary toxin subunit A [Vibrio splendidus]|uniref:alpha-xenorhabdolysin family binary toxin subunit A n=1 Tax=Vibrio splendidus TaxID=29497 RepID=UPI001FB4069E|nr:alpha-xenorhabdolysin family binary toxin subunit A [Vibrio splendidus]MCW4442679.1 alpha-xenorhabdolysin family binary toxin subunit A [Vibrio splendidus]MDH5938981.1 alpha-xenorhabdolysin family binary toxin subunit A [Vibrio splendidus]UOE87062.1 alpha-xenorhabdolysin family binary toxin subunit A [Vibrio splendidus]UOE91896.1 alpha-xenorhabdolysin family binary toxin subunit A [Vibrio splendidus]